VDGREAVEDGAPPLPFFGNRALLSAAARNQVSLVDILKN